VSGKWASSNRRAELPADWEWRRGETKKRAGGRCEAMSQITGDRKEYAHGTRCERKGSECDHTGDKMDHSLDKLEWLCWLHHRNRTQKQATDARWQELPPKREERHPGRLR
jgi:5-methylcytosine-specific restriction enzyme A